MKASRDKSSLQKISKKTFKMPFYFAKSFKNIYIKTKICSKFNFKNILYFKKKSSIFLKKVVFLKRVVFKKK